MKTGSAVQFGLVTEEREDSQEKSHKSHFLARNPNKRIRTKICMGFVSDVTIMCDVFKKRNFLELRSYRESNFRFS